jgi:polysaccharide export outer membrane protein
LIAKREDVQYFNDIKIGSQDKILYYPNTIQINDILDIKVRELLNEATEPFNLKTGAETALDGYLVSSKGEISFPRIGKIEVTGKTTEELEEVIGKLLIEKGLVNDPTVSIRIVNGKVTVLGFSGGGRTTTFAANNTLTIFEAIGTVPGTGIKNDVVLIREEDGIRRYIKLDLTKIDLVNSPYYYLKQNDVIYVKPNGPAVLTSGWLTSIGTVFGTISLAVSMYLLAKSL